VDLDHSAQGGNVLSSTVHNTFVVFCPEKFAICMFSGIITTKLGKSATHTKSAGRENTDTSLQNMPFSCNGEGHFF
jgi:hypothetical protein